MTFSEIANLVRAVAWPGLILVLLWTFREIRPAFYDTLRGRGLKSIKVLAFKAEFEDHPRQGCDRPSDHKRCRQPINIPTRDERVR